MHPAWVGQVTGSVFSRLNSSLPSRRRDCCPPSTACLARGRTAHETLGFGCAPPCLRTNHGANHCRPNRLFRCQPVWQPAPLRRYSVDTALDTSSVDTKRKLGTVAGRLGGQVGSDPFHSAGAALGLLRENPAANLRGVGQRQQQKTRRSGRAVGQISNPAKMDGLAALLTFC